MKTWKINNTSSNPVKVTVITSSTSSKGIILQPNEFCLGKPQMTSVLDAQNRRGFIKIDESFDNDNFKFDLGIAISESTLDVAKKAKNSKMSKLEKAKKDAKEYVEKK
jgi:hypothetical protein